MTAEAKQEKPTPPYVAYKSFKNFLRGLAHAIPSRIDKSVMTSMSGATQTQVLHALKYLGLIDANGVPQDKLPLLVKSEGADYQKVLQDVLRGGYPFLNDKTFDLATVTTGQLDEQFGKLAQGDTVRKCKTFFLPAAKDAGLKVSPYIKEMGKRSPSGPKAKKPRAGNESKTSTPSGAPPTSHYQAPPPSLSWHELLLSKFPSFDPSWPDDVKAKWFTSFQDLMSKGADKKGEGK